MLNREMPFGYVGFNIYGVKYLQDGKYYNLSENEVTDLGVLVEDIEAEEEILIVDLDALHWTAIKNIVQEKGGTWTNKAEGIAFLKGE